MFGIEMHAWSMEESVEIIRSRLSQQIFTQHVVVNVAKIVHMQDDSVLAESVISSDVVNIDGAGVVLGGRFLGLDIPERVTGVDLFYALLAMAEKQQYSVYLLGAEDTVIKKTVERIEAQYPELKLAGFHHGYFWDDEQKLVNEIAESKADMLFVAITSPKKERFINRWNEQLGIHFVMGVGGTFDVVAGKVNRAPPWMQKYGMEWLYRVIQEPGRMWKRYLTTNTRFAWMLLREKFGGVKP